MPLAGIALVAQTSDPNPNLQRGRRGNLTIPVLVEEAEGLLELGDLVVGELIRHKPGGGEGATSAGGIKEGKEWEAMDADARVGRKARSVQWRGVRRNFPTPDLYALPLDAAVTFGASKSPNYPRKWQAYGYMRKWQTKIELNIYALCLTVCGWWPVLICCLLFGWWLILIWCERKALLLVARRIE